jgi:hypothetical protein
VTESSDKTQPADQRKAKKPYSTPRLEAYGDLLKITNAVGAHAKPDGVNILKTRP